MKKESLKIETSENWEKAVNFIPKLDQIIIYDGRKENGVYIEAPRIKIGDGIHTVSELPFELGAQVSYAVDDNAGILIIG